MVDEIEGAVIVYDSRTEQYEVEGAVAAVPSATGGRVKVVIQPKLGDGTAPGAGGPAGAAPRPAPGGPTVAPRPAEPR